ncbi:MAG: BrnT family toxin [Bacteroidota bacterium]
MKKFEWNTEKNEANRVKHNLDFEEAKEIFGDKDSIEKVGTYKGEIRLLRIGKTENKLILLVIYTMREKNVRIISARQVSRKERNDYLAKKLSQKSEDEKDKN